MFFFLAEYLPAETFVDSTSKHNNQTYDMTSKVITELVSEIVDLNDGLKAQLEAMNLYLASARAKNWIGAGDPVYLLFKGRLTTFEMDVETYRAFDAAKFRNFNVQSAGAFSAFWMFLGLPVKDTRDELLREILKRRNGGIAMADNFDSMKDTTEKTERYSELNIEERLPKRSSVLSVNATKSFAFKMSHTISEKIRNDASHIRDRSMFGMGRLEIYIGDLIPEELIPKAFEVLSMEIDYLSSGNGAAFMKKIGRMLVGLARRFAVIMTKYYKSELGREFAVFASRRFRAIYLLVQSISSLYRGVRLLARPHTCFNFHKHEFASNTDMAKRNLQFVQRSYNDSRSDLDIKARRTWLLIFLKMGTILAATSQVALSLTLKIEPKYGEPPRNELPISAIDAFEDEVDEEFLHNPRQTILIRDIPVGLEVEPADIVPKLQSLGLYKVEPDFSSSGRIGSGSFGVILEVPWKHQNITIVLKCFKEVPDSQKARKRIVREAQIMSELQHDNILRVFGYAELPPQIQQNGGTGDMLCPIALVYPVYQLGNLQDYLRGSMTVTESEKISFMLNIASALEYLHNPNKKSGVVIHGDLRAANVLINANKQALLCDFGLSANANIGTKWCSMTFQTNPAWLAYEFFELTLPSEKKKQQKLTVKTDIYAFGCVCYEVIHEKRPYHDSEETGIDIYKRKFLKNPPTVNIPKNYRSRRHLDMLMGNCWHVVPERRPPASKLVHRLRTLADLLS